MSIYPFDAITLYHELIGPSTYTFVSGTTPKTILGVSVQQSATNSQSDIRCGPTDIFVRNYGKDFPFNILNKKCEQDIVIEKTGQDSASFIITYVPRYITNDTINASISGSLTGNMIAPDASTSASLNGITWLLFVSMGILIFLQAVHLGTWFFKR